MQTHHLVPIISLPILSVSSGVPQGGKLSPLIYIIYVADLELWLEYASAITYADDTSTGITAKRIALLLLHSAMKSCPSYLAGKGEEHQIKKNRPILLKVSKHVF